MRPWPNKSPEPTAVGAGPFRCRGSHDKWRCAQLFSLGHIGVFGFCPSRCSLRWFSWFADLDLEVCRRFRFSFGLRWFCAASRILSRRFSESPDSLLSFIRVMTLMGLTSRRSQPPLALSVPLSRFTSQVGGGSAFFVRPHRVFDFCRAVIRCGGLVGSQI